MLELKGVCKRFGGHAVTQDVSLTFSTGSLSAIIGPNGAGKTTLFNLMAGALKPDQGGVYLRGESISGLAQHQVARKGLVRAFQVASLFPSMTVFEALAAASDRASMGLNGLWRGFPSAAGGAGAWQVMKLLELEGIAEQTIGDISHGDQKMMDVGLAMALRPSVLLLDEPTAGMGPDERWKMIRMVQRLWSSGSLSVIFIEHDMDIVFSVAQDVTVLAQGRVLLRGDPETVRRDTRVVDAYLGSYGKEAA